MLRTLRLRSPAEAVSGGLSLVRACRSAGEGRFDGENSNFGTVTIEDNVYAERTEAMTRVNAAAEQIHAKAAHGV
jgi:hypothetical protein